MLTTPWGFLWAREKGEEIVVAYVYRSYKLSTREPYYLF